VDTTLQGLYHVAMIVAAIVGGFSVCLKWLYPVWRNDYTNAECLDGDISVETIGTDRSNVVISVKAVWNNRGNFAVFLNTHECSVSVTELPENLPVGIVSANATPLLRHNPLEGREKYVLEPKTSKPLRSHFALLRGKFYWIQWQMVSMHKKRFVWRRDIVWKEPDLPSQQGTELKSETSFFAGTER